MLFMLIIGVPYGIKYKDPDTPVAPLYLDCCALVRQAVQDLQEEFGFVIGKWNQAYQIDTLPIVLNKEELKPGDLIFYEGEYYSNRSKPQKHNMVHVEVYLGPNEECIGSRYHRGSVSIFPSYQFTSTTWKLVNYHFRSLDSWLSGVCVSCCPHHPWLSDALSYVEAAGKRSIFADEGQDDVSAGGEEDEQGELAAPIAISSEPVGEANPNPTLESLQQTQDDINMKENTVNVVSEDPAESSIGGSKKAKRQSQYAQNRSVTKSLTSIDSMEKPAGSQKSSRSSAMASTASSAAVPKTYYVAKANGWKLVKAALDKKGWQQLPFDYQFSSRFGLKWVVSIFIVIAWHMWTYNICVLFARSGDPKLTTELMWLVSLSATSPTTTLLPPKWVCSPPYVTTITKSLALQQIIQLSRIFRISPLLMTSRRLQMLLPF